MTVLAALATGMAMLKVALPEKLPPES